MDAVEGKYRNEYVFILYVCHYYLYFCAEGNRFRAVYGYKSTKCSSHRQPLGVQNNCPYNLYAYSASCNIYNYIIYIHKYVIHTYKSHMPHTGTHTHTHTHTGTHRHTQAHTSTQAHTGTHRHTQAHRHRRTQAHCSSTMMQEIDR